VTGTTEAVSRELVKTTSRFDWITIFGVIAAAAMVLFNIRESERRPVYTLYFACACLAAAAYGFLSHSTVFAVLEVIWGALAFGKWFRARNIPITSERDASAA
jgi:hypothetical protein